MLQPTGDNPAFLAERYFVGALLHLPASVTRQAAEVIFPAWLTDVHVRGVYSALVDLANGGAQTDPASVVPTMLRLGLPQQSAGVATSLVVDLLADVPMPSSWRLYTVQMTASRQRQRIEIVGHVLVERAHRDPLDRLHAVLEEAREEIECMTSHITRLIHDGSEAA